MSIGNGIILEQQTATLEEGFVTLKYAVKVCYSSVFADTINSRFYFVRVPDNSINPYDVISKIKMNIENTKRTWKYSKPETVEFNAKKYGTSSYIISVPRLNLGQYVISFKNSNSVNLFGIKL